MEDHVVKTLREALAGIKRESKEFEAEAAEKRKALDARERVVQTAIDGLVGDFKPSLAISQKFVDQVEAYLEEVGSARQSDIGTSLGMNSGTVSVALRRLLDAGKVERSGKERGSQVWLHSARHETGRETVVRPGEGVSEGRVAA